MQTESLFKLGQSVIVKDCLDPGTKSRDYRFGFTEDLRERFGGKAVTIRAICKAIPTYLPFKVKDDCYLYLIEDDPNNFYFSSGMFKQNLEISIF